MPRDLFPYVRSLAPVHRCTKGVAVKSAHTKQLLAESLQRLVREKPLSQITVQDIVDGCGLSRRTFYYHFEEKQDLIDWVYARDRSLSVQPTSARTLAGNLKRLVERFAENPELYAQMIAQSGAKTDRDYWFQANYDCYINLFDSHLGENAASVSKDDKALLAAFFVFGTIGAVNDAARNDAASLAPTFDRLFDLLVRLFDKGLYALLDELAESGES